MEIYRGFKIEHEFNHYRVTHLNNTWLTWTEDTVEDAKKAIDEHLDGEA